MNRTITYHITQLPFPHKISGFLKEKGHSEQNLTDLRKREQAICLNGTYVHMNQMLTKGDILTVYIQETESSEQIRPVKLPVTIVYEDEDLLVIFGTRSANRSMVSYAGMQDVPVFSLKWENLLIP